MPDASWPQHAAIQKLNQISNWPVKSMTGCGCNEACRLLDKPVEASSMALKASGNKRVNKTQKRSSGLAPGSDSCFAMALIDERPSSILRLLKILTTILVFTLDRK